MKKRYTEVYCCISEYFENVLLSSGDTIYDIGDFLGD